MNNMKNNLYLGKEGRKFWIKRIIFIPIAFVILVFVISHITMYLWNTILAEVIGVHTITFWQALGILVLSKILFSGFHGRPHHRGCHDHRREIGEKWNQLTPEQKEKIRKNWWGRFEEPIQQV
jgi:Ca2+/H+ antiporter, TMEM165/GDT1 family